MNTYSVREKSIQGLCVGAALAIVPVSVTFSIAYSKDLVKHIFLDILVRYLSNGTLIWKSGSPWFKPFEVPILWKISYFSAINGVLIATISAVAYLSIRTYQHFVER